MSEAHCDDTSWAARSSTKTIILVWAIASLGALVVVLARLTIDRSGSVGADEENMRHLWWFWIAGASGWAALTGLLLVLSSRPKGKPGERFGVVAGVVLTIALAGRVGVLLTHEPALSEDVCRYVFDGRNTASGMNPHMVSPLEREEAIAAGAAERWPGEAALVQSINNPELHTIYLPTSQWTFALTALIIDERWSDPASSMRVFRGMFTLIDLITICVLLLATRKRNRSAWWVALYAWHPLPITEIAGSGHQDIIGIALLAGALVACAPSGSTPARVGRWIWAVALAAMVKPVVLPVAAILLRGRPARTWLVSLAIGVAVCAIVAGPLLLPHSGTPARHLADTSTRFSLKWAHFGSVYEPTLTAIEWVAPNWGNDGQEQLARVICVGLLGLAMLGIWWRGRKLWMDCSLIFLAMVLLSPTAHPWYLLWAFALLPLAPLRAVWVASLTLTWGYASLGETDTWSIPCWVMAAAYVPIYIALIIDVSKYRTLHTKCHVNSPDPP